MLPKSAWIALASTAVLPLLAVAGEPTAGTSKFMDVTVISARALDGETVGLVSTDVWSSLSEESRAKVLSGARGYVLEARVTHSRTKTWSDYIGSQNTDTGWIEDPSGTKVTYFVTEGDVPRKGFPKEGEKLRIGSGWLQDECDSGLPAPLCGFDTGRVAVEADSGLVARMWPPELQPKKVGAKPVEAERGKVSGIVLTDDSTAVAFVVVVLRGTQRGAITDAEGRFRIEAIPPGDYDALVHGHGEWTGKEVSVHVLPSRETHVVLVVKKFQSIPDERGLVDP